MAEISEAKQQEELRYWKPKEVAEYFGISVSSVLHWIHTEKIEALVLPSGRYIIPARAIAKMKETNFKPEWITAEEVRARFEERERRKAAAIVRINNFKSQIERRKRNVSNSNNTK